MFSYAFIQNTFIAGGIIALIAPPIGLFLVLRRYAMITDTLAHASLAGVAIGFIMGINPLITALIVTTGSSLLIENLRRTARFAHEWALSLFLSGSLAIAIVLFSMGGNTAGKAISFLFGSILTTTRDDLFLIMATGIIIVTTIAYHWKQLITVAFDETFAYTIGIPVTRVNTLLMIATAAFITLAIPMIGILLVSALITIPVIAALQLRTTMFATLVFAEIISLCATLSGLMIAYWFDIAASGSIVIVLVAVALTIFLLTRRKS